MCRDKSRVIHIFAFSCDTVVGSIEEDTIVSCRPRYTVVLSCTESRAIQTSFLVHAAAAVLGNCEYMYRFKKRPMQSFDWKNRVYSPTSSMFDHILSSSAKD